VLPLAITLALAAGSSDLCDAPRALPQVRMTLDLKEAELHDVFRLLADTAHVNVVVPDEVSGHITLKLTNAPWGDAACTIVRAKHLTLTKVGDVFLVTGQEALGL
jgi:type II secretory pathway component HofQ